MEKNPVARRKILQYALVGFISLMAALFIQFYCGKEKNQIINRKKQFEEILRTKEQRLQNLLITVSDEKHTADPFETLYPLIRSNLWQDEGISIFLYSNDTLVYWSDNNVPAEPIYRHDLFSRPFIHYGNGWFRTLTETKENMAAVGLILVKNDFPYQNEYLVNDFQNDFELTADTKLDTVPGPVNINTEEGTFLFSFSPESGQGSPFKVNLAVFALFIVFFISLVMLLFYLYQLFDFFRMRPLLMLLAFIFDAILLRFILLYFEIPAFLYLSDLFSPYYYATSLIAPSLGDLVINSLFWLSLAWIFFTRFDFSLQRFKSRIKLTLSLLMILFTGLLFYLLVSTIRGMVFDSNIELNLNNIFNVDAFSGLGFLAMTSLVFAFFLVSSKLMYVICNSQLSQRFFYHRNFIFCRDHTFVFKFFIHRSGSGICSAVFFIPSDFSLFFRKQGRIQEYYRRAGIYSVFFTDGNLCAG